MKRSLRLAFALALAGIGGTAQPAPAPAKPVAPVKPTTTADDLKKLAAMPSDMVKITIKPSRSQTVLGTVSGLTATLHNVSDRPLMFRENETLFVIPPEARGDDSRGLLVGCATFVTQGIVRKQKQTGFDLILQPGESYPAFWDVGTNACQPELKEADTWWKKIQGLFFSPGAYDVYLVANFYDVNSGDLKTYHTVGDSVAITFTASQWVILTGAFIGGLIAWMVKTYLGPDLAASTQPWHKTAWTMVVEPIASGLFSVIIVILSSRLSDLFPIKVSADDLWGAITLGFIAQMLGVKLLQKLPGVDPTSLQPNRADTAPGGAR